MPIQTVTGSIPSESLGLTLMHEHTFCDAWEWGGRLSYNSIVDDEGLLAEELAIYRHDFLRKSVDLTTAFSTTQGGKSHDDDGRQTHDERATARFIFET